MWINIVLLVWGAYNAVSYFFLMNPTLLHGYKNKLQMPPPLHMGRYVHSHKGGGGERPEESLDAMTHSVTTLFIFIVISYLLALRCWITMFNCRQIML